MTTRQKAIVPIVVVGIAAVSALFDQPQVSSVPFSNIVEVRVLCPPYRHLSNGAWDTNATWSLVSTTNLVKPNWKTNATYYANGSDHYYRETNNLQQQFFTLKTNL